MYVSPNFKTKKALKEAVAAGKQVFIFQPNDMFGRGAPSRGKGITIEGPHYPEPHKWYAQVDVENGVVVKVK
jgi:hypothetical protein